MINFKNLKNCLPLLSSSFNLKENAIIISNDKLLFVLTYLKLHIHTQFNLLSCISGVDMFRANYRFGVVYDLLSLTYNIRLKVKTFVNEITPVMSISNIFINANWWEREVWDMYGIYFLKHPDMRRILTDYGFEGYPLRKDFPLSGFIDIKYDQDKKRVVLEPIELVQEFRFFSFDAKW